MLSVDLTYVSVTDKRNYVCFIIDFFDREIIGYSAGRRKDALSVFHAFANTKHRLDFMSIFHSNRGNEFKNNTIAGLIKPSIPNVHRAQRDTRLIVR